MTNQPQYLTRDEVAAVLRISKKGLEAMHARGEGPPYLSGAANRRPVLYDRDKLNEWIIATYEEKKG